jgi:FlaA1/EpsC-like NDP-sugar epimerase
MKNGEELSKPLQDKNVLITGGTGSLGQVLVKRLLSGGEFGEPARVVVFSRDEAKQHFMRMEFQQKAHATDEIIYRDFQKRLDFRIGDVRDFHALASALDGIDIVFNAAALKQVPTCEYFPYEAVQTNILGPENIVRAIKEHRLPVETVVGVSTDKACKPINVMGMTKAIQERLFIQANLRCSKTRFVCARYGNVLASRGSVIPLFHEQIRNGGPVTLTSPQMTRFLLSLEEAVDTILAAVAVASPGETFVPHVPSALVRNVAMALIEDRRIDIVETGIRPGEKLHESLISWEESARTISKGDWYVITPMLPELAPARVVASLHAAYSSDLDVMTLAQTREVLTRRRLMVEDVEIRSGETLA